MFYTLIKTRFFNQSKRAKVHSTSGERNHNLAQAEKISILWLIQIDAILDFSERVWVQKKFENNS